MALSGAVTVDSLSDPLRRLHADTSAQLQSLEGQSGAADARPEEVDVLRRTARGGLETLLIEAPDFAAAHSLDVKLWKACFYNPIREFRGKIARSQRQGDAKATKQLSRTFAIFLDDAAGFYMGLLQSLEAKRRKEDPTSRTLTVKATLGALIYAGDIARYRVQCEDSQGDGKKNWDRARTCYHMAIQVAPWSGNPHNQLGVVAFQAEEDFEAVYRYMRAMLAEEPFGSATENLARALRKGMDEAPDISTAATAPEFLARFLHLYRMIHGLERTQLRGDPKANTVLRSLPPLVRTTASSLSALCKNGQLTDEDLLKVFVVCIFGMSTYSISSQARLGKSNAALSGEIAVLQRLSCIAVSFSLLRAAWGVYEKRVERLSPEEDRIPIPLARRILGPSLLFLRWLLTSPPDWRELNVHRTGDVHADPSRPAAASYADLDEWDADGLKQLAADAVWECFQLVDSCKRRVSELMQGARTTTSAQAEAFLPEYIEMRGFGPTATLVASLFEAAPVGRISYTIPEKAEAPACAERLEQLEQLEVPAGYGASAEGKGATAPAIKAEAARAAAQEEDSDDSDEEDIVFSVGFGQKSAKRPRPQNPGPGTDLFRSSRQPAQPQVASSAESTQASSASPSSKLPTTDSQSTVAEATPVGSTSSFGEAPEAKVSFPVAGEVQRASDAKDPSSLGQNPSLPFAFGSSTRNHAWLASNPFGFHGDGDGEEAMNTQNWAASAAEEKVDGQKGLLVPPGFELGD